MNHAALIFNRVRDEIELDEISRIAGIVAFLLQLKCQTITIYDRKGSMRAHAKLIQALLRLQLATMGKSESFNDQLNEGVLVLHLDKLETRVVFESEEIIPASSLLNASLPQVALVFNSIRRVLRL